MRVLRFADANRILASGLSFGLVFTILLSTGVVRADTVTKSYFKAFGSDVFIGGAFDADASNSNCTANYQYATGADPDAGGIFAFAKDSGGKAAGGASSQYGAFALGDIQGDASGNGFYSGGAQAGSVSHSYSTFANTSASSWGGSFEGNVPQSSCIPDYYDKLSSYTSVSSWNQGDSTPPDGVFKATAPVGNPYTLINQDVNIRNGRSVTVYVNGNVYINHNITYTLNTVDDVPKFALVVKGSIYIDPAVSELDGLYIAQPAGTDLTADDGDIWTCHGANSDQVLYSYPAFIAACASKLTVNGSLVAKQVNLTRDNGNISSATTSEDALSAAQGSNNIGEVINYMPTMVIGGPFFNPETVNNYKVESLISLPPVF
ncbi:MAG TPA: hypothetical protein VG964_02585 [Candidatus Saccharimonadales bacterium]|nr:hypothetical protein [Candidatus Saccharimonadales bacterium]